MFGDTGFAALLGFMVGVLGMGFVLLLAVPDHQSNCDSYGMTRMGKVVYTCAPKTAK